MLRSHRAAISFITVVVMMYALLPPGEFLKGGLQGLLYFTPKSADGKCEFYEFQKLC